MPLPLFGAESRAAEPRRVLMLHAFNYTFPAATLIADGARKRLLERSPQPLEIDADFFDLARNTDAEYGREINVRLDLESGESSALGDSVQLQQVLLNLVMNAMDAMVPTPMAQRSILISTREAATGMEDVLVKDRGHGIRPNENGWGATAVFSVPIQQPAIGNA